MVVTPCAELRLRLQDLYVWRNISRFCAESLQQTRSPEMPVRRMSESEAGTLPIAKRLRLIREYRFLPSEYTPAQLISWLNAGRKSPAKNRITRIIQTLQQQAA